MELVTRMYMYMYICWLLPSNQRLYRQIAGYRRGVGVVHQFFTFCCRTVCAVLCHRIGLSECFQCVCDVFFYSTFSVYLCVSLWVDILILAFFCSFVLLKSDIPFNKLRGQVLQHVHVHTYVWQFFCFFLRGFFFLAIFLSLPGIVVY